MPTPTPPAANERLAKMIGLLLMLGTPIFLPLSPAASAMPELALTSTLSQPVWRPVVILTGNPLESGWMVLAKSEKPASVWPDVTESKAVPGASLTNSTSMPSSLKMPFSTAMCTGASQRLPDQPIFSAFAWATPAAPPRHKSAAAVAARASLMTETLFLFFTMIIPP
jgi:hypothetical protein